MQMDQPFEQVELKFGEATLKLASFEKFLSTG
jgi:hypothetical protein